MPSQDTYQGPASELLYRDMMTRFLGGVIMQAFDDPDVTEVYTNPQDQRIRTIERAGRRIDTGERIDASNVVAFLNTVATTLNTTIGADAPALQAELPLDRFRRARLQGLVPPVAPGPCFVIRKHAHPGAASEPSDVDDQQLGQSRATRSTVARSRCC